jgi:hypothetical protein
LLYQLGYTSGKARIIRHPHPPASRL